MRTRENETQEQIDILIKQWIQKGGDNNYPFLKHILVYTSLIRTIQDAGIVIDKVNKNYIINKLSNIPNLALYLDLNGRDIIEDGRLTNLAILRLPLCMVDSHLCEQLANHSAIRSLSLIGASLVNQKPELIEYLKQNKNIRELILSHSFIDIDDSKFLASLSHIQHFSFVDSGLTPRAIRELTIRSKKLMFDNCQVYENQEFALGIDCVTNLIIHRERKFKPDFFNSFRHNTTLQECRLNDCIVSDDDIKKMASHPTLTTLDLSNTGVNYAHDLKYEAANAIACHPTITDLNLSNNRVDDKSASLLSQNTIITRLNLSYNLICYADCFANNPTLENLALDCNFLSGDVIGSFAKNSSLSSLSLGHHSAIKPKAASVKALRANTVLTTLNLECTRVSHNKSKEIEVILNRNRKLKQDHCTLVAQQLSLLFFARKKLDEKINKKSFADDAIQSLPLHGRGAG